MCLKLTFCKKNCILKIEVFPWWVVLVLEEYMLRIFFLFLFFFNMYWFYLMDAWLSTCCCLMYLAVSLVLSTCGSFLGHLPFPSYWHLRLHFQHKHTNPYTQKGMQFQLLSHFPSLFVLLITRSLNVLKWLGKSWFLVLGMHSSGHKSFLAEKI